MINIKLILIEGFPGAGKTTSTAYLGEYLQEQGIACGWYLENDTPHPIDCCNFKLKDLAQKLPPLWAVFSAQASRENTVSIIESRLWQNTALFMFMSEYPVDEIIAVHRMVWKELVPLSPALIYLYRDDPETALRRLYRLRSKELVEKDIQATSQYPWFQSRGLNDIDGWIQFFTAWQVVAGQLYDDWPFRNIKIRNPHDGWTITHQQMHHFLQVPQSQ